MVKRELEWRCEAAVRTYCTLETMLLCVKYIVIDVISTSCGSTRMTSRPLSLQRTQIPSGLGKGTARNLKISPFTFLHSSSWHQVAMFKEDALPLECNIYDCPSITSHSIGFSNGTPCVPCTLEIYILKVMEVPFQKNSSKSGGSFSEKRLTIVKKGLLRHLQILQLDVVKALADTSIGRGLASGVFLPAGGKLQSNPTARLIDWR